MRVIRTVLQIGLFISLSAIQGAGQLNYFSNWSAGDSPQEVGKRLFLDGEAH